MDWVRRGKRQRKVENKMGEEFTWRDKRGEKVSGKGVGRRRG